MNRPELGPLRRPKLPALRQAELASGLRLVAARRPGVPLVELRLSFPLSGALFKKPAPTSVLTRSVLSGTRRHDRASLAEAVERLGGSLDAGADRDRVFFTGSVLVANLSQFLGLVAEVLEEATYAAEEVAADRERLSDETLIMLSRPDVLASDALRARMYNGHPYATATPRPPALLAVQAAGLRRLHPILIDPSAAHLTLVGDVQPARMAALVGETLGGWLEGGRRPDTALADFRSPRPGPLTLVDRPGSVQSNIRVAGLAPRRSDPDWPATSLANVIFGGMFGSRLVENLRERRGYTYSPHSYVSHDRAGSSFVIEADVATEVTAPALVELDYELGRVATLGITEDELEAARRYVVGNFALRTATQAGLASTLSGLSLGGVGPEYLEGYPNAILKTKKAAVDEAARRYFAPPGLVSVVVGDAERVAAPVAAVDDLTVRAAVPV